MKDDRLYRYHILESIDKITSYIEGVSRDEFLNSTLIQDAVLRNLQVLAESTQRLSPEFKAKHSEIEWHSIAGLRNILVHDYLGIDFDAVWVVVESYLQKLREVVDL